MRRLVFVLVWCSGIWVVLAQAPAPVTNPQLGLEHVVITTPTTSSTYDNGTTTTVTVSGTATASRPIQNCTYTNSLGGSGTATGTTSWSISSLVLTVGSNVITVSCTTVSGVIAQDVLTVTVSASGGSAPAAPSCGATNCYYIDNTAGLDTRTAAQARSKTTPWQHHPEMRDASSTAAAYTPQPGDIFIFKGGETWTSTSFPFEIETMGTSGSRITLTSDGTWYTGASWSRPIFDTNYSTTAGTNAHSGTIIACFSCANLNIEYLELKRSQQVEYTAMIELNESQNVTMKGLYLHGWRFGGGAETHHGGVYNTFGNSTNVILEYSVIENSENQATSGTQKVNGECAEGFSIVRYSICHHAPTAWFQINTIDTTTVYNIDYPVSVASTWDATWHSNLMYLAASGYVSNNLFYDNASGSGDFYVVTCTSADGESDIFNNVSYGSQLVTLAISFDPDRNGGPGGACGTIRFYNNTLYTPGQPGYIPDGASRPNGWSLIVVKNNHWITNASAPYICRTTTCGSNYQDTATWTESTNTPQSTASAASQGYVLGNWFAPTDSGDATIDQGENLTGSCSGNFADLCTDARLGVVEDANHWIAVGGYGRTPVARPAGGAWDTGAFHLQ